MENSLRRHYQVIHPLATGTDTDIDLFCPVIGEFRSSGRFHWQQTIESGWVVTCFLRGQGTRITNGYRMQNGAYDVALARDGDQLEYFDAPDTPWEYIWVKLQGESWESVWADLRVPMPGQLLTFNAAHRLLEVFRSALATVREGGYSKHYSRLLAWQIVDGIATSIKEEDSTVSPSAEERLADACRIVIDNRLESCPTVAELAEQFQVSRVSIFRAFRSTYGLSPKTYIDQRRFSKAETLLRDGRMSVKEVAHLCGFRDQCYFSHCFKKRFGVSPGTYGRGRQ